jgi:hypothetical protein
MTVASTLVQICYLIYITARNLGRGGGDSKIKDAAQTAALAAYVFYFIGTYLGFAEKERKADTLRFSDQRSIFRCKIRG